MKCKNRKLKILVTTISIAVCFITGNANAEEKRDFAGLKFGVGLSLTMDTGKNDRVNEANVVNDIVRVTEDSNDIPRIMLESHYFFKPDVTFMKAVKAENWGHGPFVALQPGTEDIIEAISLGWMFGFKREDSKTNSWNIGIGMVVDPNVKILGDGIEENQPLPTGETEVRLKETSQWGIIILTSFSF